MQTLVQLVNQMKNLVKTVQLVNQMKNLVKTVQLVNQVKNQVKTAQLVNQVKAVGDCEASVSPQSKRGKITS